MADNEPLDQPSSMFCCAHPFHNVPPPDFDQIARWRCAERGKRFHDIRNRFDPFMDELAGCIEMPMKNSRVFVMCPTMLPLALTTVDDLRISNLHCVKTTTCGTGCTEWSGQSVNH